MNSGSTITDTQSGFRAFAGDVIPSFRFSQKGFGIKSEMLADAAKAGLRVKEVEIRVGVLEKMLLDVEMSKYYISKWNSQAKIKVHKTK